MSFRIHTFKDFSLCFKYTVTVSKIFQMTGSDVCDHTGIWPCNLCQSAHLSKITDSHFQNSNLIFLSQAKNCEWKSQFVVKIPLCLESAVFLLQNRRDHLFGTGLSHASCNPYNRYLKLFQIKFCDILHSLKGRIYLNIRKISILKFALRQCYKCPFAHDILNKTMRIHTFSYDWNKQAVFFDLAAVCGNGRNLSVHYVFRTVVDAGADLCKILYSKIFHIDFLSISIYHLAFMAFR